MRFKLISFVLYFTFILETLAFEVSFNCYRNGIPADDLEKLINETKYVASVSINGCSAFSFSKLTMNLGAAINATWKELYLTHIQNINYNHLTEVDHHVDKLIYIPLKPTFFNLFSSIPKLKNLEVVVEQYDYSLPNLRVLSELLSLKINIHPCKDHVKSKTLVTRISNYIPTHLKSLEIAISLCSFDMQKKYGYKLSKDTFGEKLSLENLTINHFIKSIDNTTFTGLQNLTSLKITYNPLQEFNTNHLPTSLKVLDLRHNNLATFIVTNPLINLIELHLQDNQIGKFTLDLNTHFPKLEYLDLKQNSLKRILIVSDFNNPLKTLNLQDNKIDSPYIWQWAYDNRNYTDTDLTGNFPKCDNDTINLIRNLNKRWERKWRCPTWMEPKYKIDYCRINDPVKLFISVPELSSCSKISEERKCCMYSGQKSIIAHSRLEFIVFDCRNTHDPEEVQQLIEMKKNKLHNAKEAYLLLENNTFIKKLPKLMNLTSEKIFIFAEGSIISKITVEHLPQGLAELRLANNLIEEIPIDVLEKLLEMDTKLTLSQNPFKCDCSHLEMYNKLFSLQHLILDFNETACDDGQGFDPNRELCISPWTILIYFSLAIAVVVAIILIIYLRNSLEVQVFIYSRGWLPNLFRTTPDDKEYKYDAFVSFSEKDQDAALRILKILEEDQEPPFKVCYHHRDWATGERIDRQIIKSVEESRKTIIILSENFLASHWSSMEFTIAHYKMLEEKTPKLLLIIYGVVESKDLPPELNSYIKTTTYLKFDDKWFEKKLLYSLRRPQLPLKAQDVEKSSEVA